MRQLCYRLLMVWALGLGSLQASTLADYPFSSPKDELAFRQLIEELRCLVCQNESLAGSQAELAQDLRKEIYQMLINGKTKDDIIAFMVNRYGDFVLYNPPVRPNTYPLWFGPAALFLLGLWFLYRTLQRRRSVTEAPISAEEAERLRKLLDQRP